MAPRSITKSLDPIAFRGNVSYTHYLGETIRGVNLNRGDAIGVGFGASLAVKPDITMDAGFDFSFEKNLSVRGINIDGSGSTVGVFEIGTGVVLGRNLFLTVGGAIGITQDSPDFTLGIAVPYRF